MRGSSTDNVFITFDMHLQVLATLLKTLIANTILECSRCTAQCTRTLQFHFHLVRYPTIGFHCLSASIASSQTRCHYRYHVRVCSTKTMVFIASTMILLYTQPFHSDLHLRRQTSLAYGLACFFHIVMFAMRAAFQDQLSPEDSHLAKSLGRSYM